MSEQKPKIDLKARLGKKPSSPAAGASSIPPPMAGGPSAAPGFAPPGVAPQQGFAPGPQPGMAPAARPMPRPSAPPQTTPSGIPVPPFAQQPSRPAPDPGNLYGSSPVQAMPAPKPQAIRIELGEEVVEAQRRGRSKVAILALITAVIGGVVGFAVGGGAERAKGADAAIVGANDLIKEITAANGEVQKLADALKAAKEKLSKGQFPEAEVTQLGAINIPFTGKNLSGKGIGRFKPEVVAMLIEYANHTTEANDQKEKVQNVLNGAKKGIQELLDQQTKPQVRWSVILSNGPGGPWASMQPVPAPFGEKDKWPEELKVGSGKQAQSFKRYNSGNPINSDNPFYMPVEPASQAGVCPSDTIFKLRRELNDLETVLRGDNTPGDERTGLIESAQKLTDKLKQIGKEAG